MNREIKFRVYNKNAKDYVRESSCDIVIFDLITWAYYCSVNRLENIEHLVIEQFTGLYDKSNEAIFEGDILQYEESNGWELPKTQIKEIVEWDSEKLQYILKDVPSGDINFMGEVEIGYIIGNIFEMPELLKS